MKHLLTALALLALSPCSTLFASLKENQDHLVYLKIQTPKKSIYTLIKAIKQYLPPMEASIYLQTMVQRIAIPLGSPSFSGISDKYPITLFAYNDEDLKKSFLSPIDLIQNLQKTESGMKLLVFQSEKDSRLYQILSNTKMMGLYSRSLRNWRFFLLNYDEEEKLRQLSEEDLNFLIEKAKLPIEGVAEIGGKSLGGLLFISSISASLFQSGLNKSLIETIHDKIFEITETAKIQLSFKEEGIELKALFQAKKGSAEYDLLNIADLIAAVTYPTLQFSKPILDKKNLIADGHFIFRPKALSRYILSLAKSLAKGSAQKEALTTLSEDINHLNAKLRYFFVSLNNSQTEEASYTKVVAIDQLEKDLPEGVIVNIIQLRSRLEILLSRLGKATFSGNKWNVPPPWIALFILSKLLEVNELELGSLEDITVEKDTDSGIYQSTSKEEADFKRWAIYKEGYFIYGRLAGASEAKQLFEKMLESVSVKKSSDDFSSARNSSNIRFYLNKKGDDSPRSPNTEALLARQFIESGQLKLSLLIPKALAQRMIKVRMPSSSEKDFPPPDYPR